MVNLQELEKIFFKKVYPGKSRYPLYRSIFSWLLEAAVFCQQEVKVKVLNIYSSHDRSSDREDIYRNYFFSSADYQELDFSRDAFIDDSGASHDDHIVPFSNETFDLVITTKVILEHVSNPQKVINEFYRILKKGGEAFLIAPLVRRQHQTPYDFFRFSEFALEHLLKKAGFEIVYIKPSNGAVTTAAFMSTFFVSGLPWPLLIKKAFFGLIKLAVDPISNFLDRYDRDRKIPIYFLIRVRKIA